MSFIKRSIMLLMTSIVFLAVLSGSIFANTGTGTSPEDPMSVPEEGLVIKNGIYYGISKTWFQENNPQGATLYFSILIPDNVTTIASDGFRDSYSSDKKNNGAVTNNDNLGRYNVVAIDFSKASSLVTIKSQAAYGCMLSGVLDLSQTQVTTIEKSAFNSCSGLTGIILPKTLTTLGASDGSAGSVFNGCKSLQFVRTADGDPDAVFELPSNLRVIGKQTFKDTFSKEADLKIHIPASVEIIGSEAFYSNSCFSQIYIDRTENYDKYDSGAFKAANTTDCLLIFPTSAAYNSTGAFTRVTKTYPVILNFLNGTSSVVTQKKLFGQSIQYYFDDNKEIWVIDTNYALPSLTNAEAKPGYDAGWVISGGTEVLTNTSKVKGWTDGAIDVTVKTDAIVSSPEVTYTMNGQAVTDSEEGVQCITVTVSAESPGSVGVQVTHPLATQEAIDSGTYVYFKYCWWDEKDNGVNGPRSQEEPDLFSSAVNSSTYNRVFTDQASIPIRSSADARMNGNYYLVEVYGYYVEENGSPKQYYKSAHNFIAGQDGTSADCFLMEVDVTDTTPVTIAPADVTVYMGGDSYDGVVDSEGNIQADSSGLPEAGFYVMLPEDLNNELKATLGVDTEKALDLSPYLTFHSGDRTWTLEPYDGEETSVVTIDGIERYIYRLVAGDNQDPVRMQFTDADGAVQISDQFELDTALFSQYDMSIYPGAVDQNTVYAEIDTAKIIAAGGDPSKLSRTTCAVSAQNGTLTIRGVTQEGSSNPVVEQITETVQEITATAPSGTEYYVNDSQVKVVNGTPSLLVDAIVHTEESDKLLTERALQSLQLTASDNLQFDFRYLDLVDSNNGNTWITAGNPVSVYWPYPDGTNQNTRFYLVHFDGLDREMNVEDLTDRINAATITQITLQKTEYGIAFETDSFSPFALIWETPNCTLTYESNGGTIYSPESYAEGTTVQLTKTPTREGYSFTGWYADQALTQKITSIEMTADKTVYAGWKDEDVPEHLNGEDHYAYIIGYPDGTVKPEGNITRAEAATIFFRLLEQEIRDDNLTTVNSFDDVTADKWYNTAVSTLASLRILEGRPGNVFDPDATITRAEFAAICARFDHSDVTATDSFSDISGHWAEEEINRAAALGWIEGYGDDTFRPDQSITRAEAVTMINRMLKRLPQDETDLLDNMNTWSDNPTGTWYYLAIQEASNSHNYQRKEDNVHETWLEMREDPDWTQYQ